MKNKKGNENMKKNIQIGRRALAVLLLLAAFVGLVGCRAEEPQTKNEGYYIMYQGVKIQPGSDATGLVEQLGTPVSEKNNGNCGGQGVQMKYTYSSFDLYLLETADGKVTVDQISLKDDLLETPKGICIGSDEADVKEAYGTPTETTSKTLIYRNDRQELIFQLEGGRVVGIDLIHPTDS